MVGTVVLDAGALIAIDRGDREIYRQLRAVVRREFDLRTNSMVVAQVWRNARGRQAQLAQVLESVKVESITDADGRAAGALLEKAGTSDPIDASVVLLAERGDRILTSDPADLAHLAEAAGVRVLISPC